MKKSFLKGIKNELDNEKSVTENGAVGYKTTGSRLMDINFAVSSMRSMDESDIIKKFSDAYYENKLLALKWLFFASDVRGGLGERRLFRICLKWLSEIDENIAKAVISIVPEYSRWDNIMVLFNTSLRQDVVKVIESQLESDIDNMKRKKSISLLSKWLPSINTSSLESRKTAKLLAKDLGLSEREYRKMLSKLRKYLKVVEVSMSSNDWKSIKYEAVPSKANILYKDAFMRHDSDRRTSYLESLKNGETKINSSTAFPHDIIHKYMNSAGNYGYSYSIKKDDTLEAMWKALPNFIKDDSGKTICVVDGSGSMYSTIGGTNLEAIQVACGLGIYFAEKLTGEFNNKFITFSNSPQLVDMSNARSLYEKIKIVFGHNEVSNTNIYRVFKLILDTAVNNNMKQSDLPKNILIISDMEFDGCASFDDSRGRYTYSYNTSWDNTLFDEIGNMFAKHGYKIPRLVFWNVNSRTGTIPMKENDRGVALVSGFSPSIADMVLSGRLDPLQCLIDKLNTERYKLVEKTVKSLID